MKDLSEGFRRFSSSADAALYSSLAQGQQPHTLVISCSDSRVIPELIFDAAPGEIFVLRNVGNIARAGEPSARAGIDYAIRHLRVRNIVVLGHENCGAVEATRHKEQIGTDGLRIWLEEEEFRGDDRAEAEKAHLLRQLDRIKRCETVRAAIDTGSLDVYACYFRMDPLSLEIYTNESWQSV